MLTPDQQAAVGNVARVLRIIILALMAGPAIFLAFVAFVLPPPQAADGDRPSTLITPVAAGMAGILASMSVVLPQVIGAQGRKAIAERRPLGNSPSPPADDAVALLAGYQTRRIVAAALLEGGAFFNILAYLQERQWYSAAIAIALIVGVGMLLPIRTLVEQWLERELRAVRELRDLNR